MAITFCHSFGKLLGKKIAGNKNEANFVRPSVGYQLKLTAPRKQLRYQHCGVLGATVADCTRETSELVLRGAGLATTLWIL